MIGCAEEDARDFSQQMKQMNADSITDRIKRTMTGIFTTQRQNSAQSSNPLSPENSSAANFFKFQNIRSRQDSNSQESSGPNGVIASSSSATATNAFNVGSIENALTPAAPSVSAPAPPLQRSTSKSLDMPSVSVKAVQSWMMGAMVGSRRPPSVASPEPATQSMLSVLPEDASDGSAIPNDTHSPDKAPDGIVGSNSSATPTAAEEEEGKFALSLSVSQGVSLTLCAFRDNLFDGRWRAKLVGGLLAADGKHQVYLHVCGKYSFQDRRELFHEDEFGPILAHASSRRRTG